MSWHAKPITIHLRRFADGKKYGEEFVTIATAQLLEDGHAFVCGFLNDGSEADLTKQDLVEMGQILREKYGVRRVSSERRAKPRNYDTGPAPL